MGKLVTVFNLSIDHESELFLSSNNTQVSNAVVAICTDDCQNSEYIDKKTKLLFYY